MTTSHAFPLEPTTIRVPDGVLDDLRARLALTRSPLDGGEWGLVLRRRGQLSP